ncbi:MAG: HD-GYP domain-containing protein [Silvibacterium sp.]|nr:HD-GYP domain-containing protein [Silvibacterium sp.]MBV8630787.1 HD-GYP domain-containing protein [Silvibacterium sp.]
MAHRRSIRRRVFWRVFFSLSGASVISLVLLYVSARLHWGVLALMAGILLFWAALALLAGRRLTGLSHSFSETIQSRSLQRAETAAIRLRGTLYEEPAAEWQMALRTLENLFLDKQIEASQNYTTLSDLIRMFAKAVDERTNYLRGHSDRVAVYAADIARELGVGSEEVERIRLAALLHDIGTLGIEDAIVRKEAPLTPEEFEIVKAHTVRGASILRPIDALADLIPGVELHHESLDGQGYPYGLRGDQIPTMARIIAVADSFDAMTTARPYQAAMDAEYVLEVLNRLAGKRYDPSAVSALIALVRRGKIVVKSPRPPVSFPQQPRVLSEIF